MTLEDLDIVVHFVKEGQVISRESTISGDIDLRLQSGDGSPLLEQPSRRSEEGHEGEGRERRLPRSCALFGYRNNRGERTIEIDPIDELIVRRAFELYATGDYSLKTLASVLTLEAGKQIPTANLHWILRNPFYTPVFQWGGQDLPGEASDLHCTGALR